MLSNKDFAQLLSQKDSSKGDGGKVRFDLKQISDWDKQIRAKQKNKLAASKTPKREESATKTEVTKESSGYRDRAEERRKDANPDYDNESLKAVVQLDAEKTKFLGGDVDHTHLVKGLDYTLLKKIRDQVETQIRQISEDGKIKENSNNNFIPITTLGNKLKSLLLHKESVINDTEKVITTSLQTSAHSVFARTSYEYDLDPNTVAELPTIISRSKLVS